MTASVFVGISVDGFMARPNGDLDWLPAGGGEPHGYDEFMASVDAIVLGRKSFEKVLTLGPWVYGDKRVVVLSTRPVDLSAAIGGVVEQMSGSPAEIVALLAASGAAPVTWHPTHLSPSRSSTESRPMARACLVSCHAVYCAT